MSTLVMEMLKAGNPLYQEIGIEKGVLVQGVRLWVYREKNPSGILKMTILKNDNEIASKEIELEPLYITGQFDPNGYSHGMLFFEIKPLFLDKGQYKIKLEGIGGYSYQVNRSICWCKVFENRIVPIIEDMTDFSKAPYGVEIIELKKL